MKRSGFILLLILLSQYGYSKSINVAGSYINLDGDTLDCRFKIPLFKDHKDIFHIDFSIIQRKVKVINTDGYKYKLRPNDAISIQFFDYNDNIVYNLISKKDNISIRRHFNKEPRIFLKSEFEGQVKLYSYYKKRNFPPLGQAFFYVSVLSWRYYYQIADSGLIKIKRKQFNKELETWSKDCPDLKDKMNNKFETLNLYGIFNVYNNCLENK